MKITSLLITLSLVALAATRAQAHAFLEEAEPRVGSTVEASPAQVKIWFTEKLKHDSSNIAVFDAGGNEVDKKDSKIDTDNPLLMSVSVGKLPPGRYKVSWNAVAIDTHHTNGTFNFTVKP